MDIDQMEYYLKKLVRKNKTDYTEMIERFGILYEFKV
jgi:hypothetical protein